MQSLLSPRGVLIFILALGVFFIVVGGHFYAEISTARGLEREVGPQGSDARGLRWDWRVLLTSFAHLPRRFPATFVTVFTAVSFLLIALLSAASDLPCREATGVMRPQDPSISCHPSAHVSTTSQPDGAVRWTCTCPRR